jgi:hypothetical protein
MAMGLRSVRAVLALSLLALACSGGGDDPGPSGPVASVLVKSSGDDQSGLPGAALPQPLEVRLTDQSGVVMANVLVTFSTTAGTVNPTAASTDTQGRARTLLTLPSQAATVTVTASAQGVAPVTFTARAVPLAMNITTAYLPAARANVQYDRTLAATGGAPAGTLAFSVSAGSLPAGLTLGADGKLAGTPTTAGAYPITVRVSDGQSSEATRQFTLNVCDPVTPMTIGEVRTMLVSQRGSCGFFLPAGVNNTRYRVTIARTDNGTSGTDVSTVSFVSNGNGVTGAAAAVAGARASTVRAVDVPDFQRNARRIQASRPAHERDLLANEALMLAMGTEGLLRSRSGPLARAAAAAVLPDKIRLDPGTPGVCATATPAVTAIKLAENDWLAIYQDSAQNSILSTQVTPQDGAKLIEFATTYGKPIIDRYFGGVADIDGNGKVIVFVTPAIGQALGKVWTGNFYRKADCAASNEGEYVQLHWEAAKGIAAPGTQHLGQYILTHELRHVTSLYQRILRAGGGVVDARRSVDYNPLWMEEGGAELAAELAARYAWSLLGGPPMNVRVTDQHFTGGQTPTTVACQVSPTEAVRICTENFAVLFMLFGAQEHLSFQPNSVVARTPGASDSYVYSSGWTFQRWLSDAFGNAASAPMADSAFWRRLNDQSSPAGVLGIETATGRSWAQLMEDFALASTAHGWGGITVPRQYTTYDFITAIEMWCFAVDPVDFVQSQCGGQPGPPGAFPWPVTTDAQGVSESRSLADGVVEGTAGASGIRVHELLSNGTGRGTEVNVETTAPVRIVVIRLR